jgi:hypothetical protein
VVTGASERDEAALRRRRGRLHDPASGGATANAREKMASDRLHRAVQIAVDNRVDDGDMLPTPFAHPASIAVAAEFEQPPQPVLLPDGAQEVRIATELGDQLVKGGVDREQLQAADRGDVGMGDERKMLAPNPLERDRIDAETRQPERRRLQSEPKVVARSQGCGGVERRAERPAASLVALDEAVLGESRQRALHDQTVEAVAPLDLALGEVLGDRACEPIADQPLVELLVGARRHLDLDPMQRVNRLREEEAPVAPRLDHAPRGEQFERRPYRRARHAEEIAGLLFAEMAPALQPRVAHEIEDLIGKTMTARARGLRHGATPSLPSSGGLQAKCPTWRCEAKLRQPQVCLLAIRFCRVERMGAGLAAAHSPPRGDFGRLTLVIVGLYSSMQSKQSRSAVARNDAMGASRRVRRRRLAIAGAALSTARPEFHL